MNKAELIEFISNDTMLPFIQPWAVKQIVDCVWHNALKEAANRIREWDRDFDDHYLTSDSYGYSRIMQTELEEDLVKVIMEEK